MSPVVTLVIKDRDRKLRAPVMGQKVRVEGLEAEFIVVRVDAPKQVTDLMSAAGTHSMRENVPFRLLQPVHATPMRHTANEGQVPVPTHGSGVAVAEEDKGNSCGVSEVHSG